MYRSILVPLDGTAFGEGALPLARAIARRSGAALHLCHVHTETVVPAAVESLPYLGAGIPTPPTEEQHAYLAGVAERLRHDGVPVTTELARGPLTDSLVRSAATRGVNLVVACTHCHDGVTRLWHRGVGDRILRDTAIPTLLIRDGAAEGGSAPQRDVAHLLVPLDGSPAAEQIVERAVAMARTFGARITLLRVVRPLVMVSYSLLGEDAPLNHFVLEDQRRGAEAYLEGIARRIRARGLEVAVRVTTDDDPARGILEAIRAEPGTPPVDLIAMTTRCRGPLTRAVLSSVSDNVLHAAPVPVLLHRPLAAAEGAAVPLRVLRAEPMLQGQV